MTTATPAVVGARVRVHLDVTTLSGNRHPFCGRCGIVTGERRGGTLELEIAGTPVQLARDAVHFLADDELSHDLVPLPDDRPAATAPAAPPTPEYLAAKADTEFAVLQLSAIVRSKTNPRKHFDPEKMRELANSIAANGVHQAVLVRPLPGSRVQETAEDREPGDPLPTYELVAGERRFRACRIAHRTTIPAMVRALTDAQVLVIQLEENLQRDDLHEMEEAEGYEQLVEMTGIRKEEIAERVGKSRAYVYARLNLLKLTADARKAFATGAIDFSRALLISRIPDAELQKKALDWATKKDYEDEQPSFRALQRRVHQDLMLPLDRARFKITQVDLVPTAGSCRECEKRTGANPDIFSDVKSADVCTDPKCYHAKEEAHDAVQVASATASGKKVIVGSAAKEIWPRSYSEDLEGFVRVDRADTRTGSKKTVKSLLGKDSPETTMLVSPHDGKIVEVLPRETVTKILKDKGHLTAQMARMKRQPSEHEVAQKVAHSYEDAWRSRAIEAVWQEMNGTGEGVSDEFLRLLAKNLVGDLRQDERAHVAKVLGLGKVATHEGIRAHLDDVDACDGQRVHQVLQLLAMQIDMKNMVDYSSGGGAPTPYIDTVAADYGVDLAAIKAQVVAEMKAEAARKAAAPAAVPAKGKAAPKKKTKDEAAAGIAEALAAADAAPSPNDFSVGDVVMIKINLKGAKGKVLRTAGLAATIESKGGDRAWWVRFGVKQGDIAAADYTELRHADGDAPTDTAKPTLKADAKGAPVKYRCKSTGSTWSGRGVKPAWVRIALEDGKTLEDLAYQPAEENAEASSDDTNPVDQIAGEEA